MIGQTEGAEITGDPECEIEQIEYDSRLVKQGSLFVAIKGFQRDGYDFAEAAIAGGAVAVMGERESFAAASNHVHVPDSRKALADVAAAFYGFPGLALKACGVTGTNGKTTTCYLIREMMQAREKKVGLITSQVYDTGTQKFKADRTTPESLDIQRLLFLMKNNYCVNAVIEVSSHALTLHRVDHINFRVAVYTNLTRDHLDYHKSMEEYFAAKAMLAAQLEGPLSYMVVNLDVPEFRPLFGEDKPFISYSLSDSKADIYCGDYELRADGTTFDVVTPMGTRTVQLKLPGRFNLQNALAAIGGGLASGVDLDNVVIGLEKATPVPGRLNVIDQGQPFALFVAYAHTPDAITRVGETLREFTQGKLWVLFGCGGDRDKGKRPQMGQAAVEIADEVIVTSDNPRSEDPLAIIEDIKPGLKGKKVEIIAERGEAITQILSRAKDGDTVLLAGKGAETYQEIKGERLPFSDSETAIAALNKMGYSRPARGEES